MPKKGRGAGGDLDPLKLPTRLKTALEALYGHYEKTFELWQQRGISVPPCFIVVCQNTAISKLVYDYISGFYRKHEDDPALSQLQHGALRALRQLRRDDRQSARAPEHAADRFRGARIGRSARRQVPRDGGGRDRALPSRHRRTHGRRARRRDHHRPGAAARGDEHGRQEGPARRRHPVRRVGLDAHRRVGRQQRHPHPRHPRVRHAAALRTGDRPRAPASVVRPQRRQSVRRRIRRHLRRAVRLHRQAGRRAAEPAERDRAGEGGSAGPGPSGDSFPARRGLSRGAADRAAHGHLQCRLGVGADAGSRWSDATRATRASSAKRQT